MTTAAFILIVYLSAGGLRVSMTEDLYTCIARSQYEIRFDPQVLTECVPQVLTECVPQVLTECVPHTGGEA